jgi:hypothetical protein
MFASDARCLTIVLSALVFGAMAERANGNATAYRPVKLQQQVADADYVAHVVILEIQSLDHVDNGPVQSCGLNYRVRIIEPFKGKRDTVVVAFSTDRLLLPQRRLRTGDHVLVLLRNAPNSIATVEAVAAADTLQLQQSVSMSAGTEACRRARSALYLPDFAENIFPITFEHASKAWFEFSSGRTIIPADVGSSQLARCESVALGGCIKTAPDRIEWERVRKALIAATKQAK